MNDGHTSMDKMVSAVKAHAISNYAKDGWDYVVECWEDQQIQNLLEDAACVTEEQAINEVGSVVGVMEEQRFDAQAASGELEYYGIVEKDGKLVRAEDC